MFSILIKMFDEQIMEVRVYEFGLPWLRLTYMPSQFIVSNAKCLND